MVDTWAVHFPSAQTLFTSLQSFYINHGDYHLFKVKWLSTCPKIRSVHIEWKPPASMVYSIIPNSYLARSLGNAFSYAEPDYDVPCQQVLHEQRDHRRKADRRFELGRFVALLLVL